MKVVTVHRGQRDNFQVARALSDAGMLESLVTDLYWPSDRSWARTVEHLAPKRVARALRSRYTESLPSSSVVTSWLSGLYCLAVSKLHLISFEKRRDTIRRCDLALGRRAGELASRRGAAFLSYSYYAHSGFSHYTSDLPRILFQLHPHPMSVRQILRKERDLHPECAESLDKEWELSLPEVDFERLVQECGMAEHWMVASSFSKQTLVENGLPAHRIHVIPYGTDLDTFRPRRRGSSGRGPLQLLFVGTLGQRKGISYLLEAINLLPPNSVELTVCGRPVDDLGLFRQSQVPVRLRPNASADELREAYQTSDLFVFPSVAEGFGHVLLEAMASGLPIISTTRTAAPDLIREGKEGFVTQPGDSVQLAKCVEYFLQHPERLDPMRKAARQRAEHFTWERFRTGVAKTVAAILEHPKNNWVSHACSKS